MAAPNIPGNPEGQWRCVYCRTARDDHQFYAYSSYTNPGPYYCVPLEITAGSNTAASGATNNTQAISSNMQSGIGSCERSSERISINSLVSGLEPSSQSVGRGSTVAGPSSGGAGGGGSYRPPADPSTTGMGQPFYPQDLGGQGGLVSGGYGTPSLIGHDIGTQPPFNTPPHKVIEPVAFTAAAVTTDSQTHRSPLQWDHRPSHRPKWDQAAQPAEGTEPLPHHLDQSQAKNSLVLCRHNQLPPRRHKNPTAVQRWTRRGIGTIMRDGRSG